MRDAQLHPQSAAALAKLVETNWSSAQELERIAKELSFRTSKPARALQSKVDARIREIKENGGGFEADKLRAQLNALQEALKASEQQRKALEVRIAELKSQQQRSTSANAKLYETIGAVESIPDFGLKALRTAFRKTYHPDHFEEKDKLRAQRAFQEFEGTFERIATLRGRKF